MYTVQTEKAEDALTNRDRECTFASATKAHLLSRGRRDEFKRDGGGLDRNAENRRFEQCGADAQSTAGRLRPSVTYMIRREGVKTRGGTKTKKRQDFRSFVCPQREINFVFSCFRRLENPKTKWAIDWTQYLIDEIGDSDRRTDDFGRHVCLIAGRKVWQSRHAR